MHASRRGLFFRHDPGSRCAILAPMRIGGRSWVPLVAALLGGGCTSTTENESGPGTGGSAGGTATAAFEACRKSCGLNFPAGAPAFRDELDACSCYGDCQAKCGPVCSGGEPTIDCVTCASPGQKGCLDNQCAGECASFRACLSTCPY